MLWYFVFFGTARRCPSNVFNYDTCHSFCDFTLKFFCGSKYETNLLKIVWRWRHLARAEYNDDDTGQSLGGHVPWRSDHWTLNVPFSQRQRT